MVNAVMHGMGSALVVDDDFFSRAIFRKRLEEMDFTDIQEADNGRDALRIMLTMSRTPDILICDIFMPDMDGIEFIVELASRKYQGRIILVTGGKQEMLDVASHIANAHALKLLGGFVKPVSLKLLRQTMGIAPDGRA